MCGISGYAWLGRSQAAPAETLLKAMAGTLQRRGPDGTALHVDGPVGLAFTRLSIVDPVGGDQPIFSPDGSVALIANGEIYNHKELAASLPARTMFRSASDCEVLVHLYQRHGLGFLDQVRGIYALALWDRRKGRLIFARDRFAIKPLYFHRDPNRIIFGSEIKTLFADPACPRRLDWHACLTDQTSTSAPVFAAGHPITYFEEIESVPAATLVEFDVQTGRRRDHKYWRLPSFGGDDGAGRDELVAAYRDALSSSVEESCMSDAEIGLMLSGGIDSAAVAAFARVPQPLQTFTVLNGGTLANGDGEYAHRVAAALRLPNHQVQLSTSRVPSTAEWRSLLWQVESPLCGPEQFYKFELHRYARSVRPDLKVMLLGQASDEFNGGYSTVLGEGGWPDFATRLDYMARTTALQHKPQLAPWWDHEFPLLRDEVLHEYAGERTLGTSRADPYQAFVEWKYRDIQQYNCWHEDRTAAGNGIEARVPFLDHRVIEAVAAVPVNLRPELLWDKQMLRAALDGMLPADILKRPKVPFFYGPGEYHVNQTFSAMLVQDDGALLEQALSGHGARRHFDADGLRATVESLRREPGRGHIAFVLRMINLGLLEQMLASPPSEVSRADAPVAGALTVRDWQDEVASITAGTVGQQQLDPGLIPAWAAGVMLVEPVPADGTSYIVVNGTIEYVVSEEADPAWAAVARRIDGSRTIGELTGIAGKPSAELERRLADAIAAGLLQLQQPAEVAA